MTGLARLRSHLAAPLLALMLAACGESVELLSAIPESEANEILATLLQSSVPARKVPGKEGMVGVAVDGHAVAEALRVMRAHGLPHERFARMGEVFKKEGLISSPLEERARYVYALSQELAETVSHVDGVITARVHVVLPDRGPGAAESLAPSSASVFIKYKETYDLESVVPQIKRLVTNGISNLTYDNVSVVMVPSMATGGVAGGPSDPATVSLFGLQVAPQSRTALATGAAALLLLAMAGIGGAGAMYWLWRIKPRRGGAADAAR